MQCEHDTFAIHIRIEHSKDEHPEGADAGNGLRARDTLGHCNAREAHPRAASEWTGQ